ncbi:alkylhydroperoxidase AhpD family core domain-containing protein [Enhydrobacter aerosaccus]|uniref:Alkylhydroperoxidase AhpD family core domain-containing protein n=1 Tax=Enhydrobacter aerosaccus TaxID=225324 RepID=A0A1T4T9G8_9HYPH|nr:carboxymuconolactone decarboxylase family protein [Enhydrobacter aerosaccus]SKA37134.1 alkylhydroperoxidase AhpD family core domain-containing protein [Enhydrobacter aerosaccus]
MQTKPISAPQAAPEGYAALRSVETYVRNCGLPFSLIELVKMRASQINGCAYCLAMHSKDARKHGETEERLYLLNAWRESSLYTPAEKAALAWTETLTLMAQRGDAHPDFGFLRQHFSDKEIVDLTILIGMINLWNRYAVGLYSEQAIARAEAA